MAPYPPPAPAPAGVTPAVLYLIAGAGGVVALAFFVLRFFDFLVLSLTGAQVIQASRTFGGGGLTGVPSETSLNIAAALLAIPITALLVTLDAFVASVRRPLTVGTVRGSGILATVLGTVGLLPYVALFVLSGGQGLSNLLTYAGGGFWVCLFGLGAILIAGLVAVGSTG